jgi:hypothetical protein
MVGFHVQKNIFIKINQINQMDYILNVEIAQKLNLVIGLIIIKVNFIKIMLNMQRHKSRKR